MKKFMKQNAAAMFGAAMLAAAGFAQAQTEHFVWKDNPGTPVAPYTNWATAAREIQSAIDEAAAGAVIWVTNGTYDTGGKTGYPAGTIETNRVAIYMPITVRSVNGPDSTFITGARDPETTNGAAAVRCVYMEGGASLIGFTLAQGATPTSYPSGAFLSGGGVFADTRGVEEMMVSNCVITGNTAAANGGGVFGWRGELNIYGCRVAGNSTGVVGGGVNNASRIYNSVISGNSSASYGGGVQTADYIYNCEITGNTSGGQGGGVHTVSSVHNSTILGNSAAGGASASRSANLYNCIIRGNLGTSSIWGGNMYSCLIVGNEVSETVRYAYSYNSTIIGNKVGVGRLTSLYNSIVYYNELNITSAGANEVTYMYSCATPAAPLDWDVSNITNEPMIVDPGSGFGLNHIVGDYCLLRGSPCFNTGLNFDYMSDPEDPRGKDLDGGPRIRHNTVDMGAYELRIPRGSVFSVD